MAPKIATFIVGTAFSPLFVALSGWWLTFYSNHIEARFASHMESASWRSPGAQLGNAQIGVLVEAFVPVIIIGFAYVLMLFVIHGKLKLMAATERGKSQIVLICTVAALAYVVLQVLTPAGLSLAGAFVAALFFGGLMLLLGYGLYGAPLRR